MLVQKTLVLSPQICVCSRGRDIECAALALGAMSSLTDVAIEDVCPAGIELPYGCSLHVFGRPTSLNKCAALPSCTLASFLALKIDLREAQYLNL